MYANNNFEEFCGPNSKLQKICSKAANEILKENLNTGSDCCSSAVKYMQDMQSMMKPEEFLRSNVEFISDASQKSLEYVQHVSSIFGELTGAYADLFSKNMSKLKENK